MGSVLFNLCVVDIQNCLPNCTCLQYADDSSICQHCTVKDLKTCCVNIEKDLFLNATKTKLLLLTVAQMNACHKLDKIKRPRNRMQAIRISKWMETSRCNNRSTLRLKIPYQQNIRIYNLISGPHITHFSVVVANKRKISSKFLFWFKRTQCADSCRQQLANSPAAQPGILGDIRGFLL